MCPFSRKTDGRSSGTYYQVIKGKYWESDINKMCSAYF